MKRTMIVLGLFLFVIVAVSARAQSNLPRNQREDTPKEPEIVEGDFTSPLAILDNVISIPAAAFTWDGAVYNGGFFKDFSGGYLTGTGEGFACLCAPIIFPKGASRISKVVVTATHAAESGMGYFRLCRVDLATGGLIELGEVLPSQSINPQRYTIIPSLKAIAPRFAYYLATCVYEDFFVYGAKVYYTVTQ